jgi:hypothetical protein
VFIDRAPEEGSKHGALVVGEVERHVASYGINPVWGEREENNMHIARTAALAVVIAASSAWGATWSEPGRYMAAIVVTQVHGTLCPDRLGAHYQGVVLYHGFDARRVTIRHFKAEGQLFGAYYGPDRPDHQRHVRGSAHA